MHEAFVHAYWHSHHWVLVPKDVVENNLQSWMHKSILLLKDLTPSSEDAIDSCTQLFPTPQTSSCANKTAFYRLLLRNPNVHFPPRRVGSTWSPRPRSENRRMRGGGQLESRSQGLCPNPSGNLPQLLCQGDAEQEAVLREQQWRRTTNLNIRKQAHAYEGHVWYLSINYKPFHSQAAFFQANHLLQSYWPSRKDLILYC